ncbi:OmpA family protein [Roseateles sp.]|uniref:OmpA family protein n=1 Tax=Roseateles sp. TaxID=1971397 RepID=UPI002E05E333|nr:OmpA family protein [Roseateles sp.]
MFASGQGSLSPASLEALQKVGQALKAVPGQVLVTGHTDNQPSPDPAGLNARLSLARAQAVAQVLAAQGVPQERLTAQGRGAEAPMASNDTPAGRAQNRRVEIQVQTAPR